MLLLIHEKVNVFSLWTVLLTAALLSAEEEQTVKSISPLPRSAVLNEVAMSSFLTCTMPCFFSKWSFCFVFLFLSEMSNSVLSLRNSFLSTLWCNKHVSSCLIASMLHDPVMASTQLQDLSSALMCFLHLLYMYATCVIGREPLCVWACPHMPMDFNDGS